MIFKLFGRKLHEDDILVVHDKQNKPVHFFTVDIIQRGYTDGWVEAIHRGSLNVRWPTEDELVHYVAYTLKE